MNFEKKLAIICILFYNSRQETKVPRSRVNTLGAAGEKCYEHSPPCICESPTYTIA